MSRQCDPVAQKIMDLEESGNHMIPMSSSSGIRDYQS